MQKIKDSGQRTEYPTGFVRDMHEGKGRFDLLPWGAIWEGAKHCEEGAEKYGERNIDKGAPQHSLIDSAIRHLAKYLMGYNDENHLRAAWWNISWALEQDTYKPEMQDIPARLEPSKALTALHQLQKMDELFKAAAADAAKLAPTPEEAERLEEGEKILEKAEDNQHSQEVQCSTWYCRYNKEDICTNSDVINGGWCVHKNKTETPPIIARRSKDSVCGNQECANNRRRVCMKGCVSECDDFRLGPIG